MNSPTLKIRFYGDPCLRKRSKPVKDVGPSERLLIQSMIATLHDQKGIGLAAPQIGINQRIFIADVGDGPIAVINPKVVKKKGSEVIEEGCLSIPNVTVEVKRAKQLVLKYTDENNQEVEHAFEDLLARVILHEIDHLDGKLIVDYASKEKLKEIESKLKEIKKSDQ